MSNLYNDFKEACKELCRDFSINPKNIKFEKPIATPFVGVDYEAKMSNDSLEITFHLRTDSKSSDPTDGERSGSLTVKDSDSAHSKNISRSFNHNLQYSVNHLTYDYNIENNPINFKKMFRDMIIKVYGFPGYSEPGNSEFIIFMTGITSLSTKNELEVIAYRFRHRTEDEHFFYSYAIFIPEQFWVFFPDSAGGGGGSGETDLNYFEKILNKHRKYGTQRKFFDVEYKKLEAFLLEKELGFTHSITNPDIPFPLCNNIITKSSKKLFLDEHYAEAIFEATKVLEKEIKRKSGIKDKIGGRLIDNVFDKNNLVLDLVNGSEREHDDERDGLKLILRGIFLGIKNPGSHSLPKIDNPLVASQYISLIALMFDKIKNSKKIRSKK